MYCHKKFSALLFFLGEIWRLMYWKECWFIAVSNTGMHCNVFCCHSDEYIVVNGYQWINLPNPSTWGRMQHLIYFLRSLTCLNSSKPVVIPKLKSPACSTVYLYLLNVFTQPLRVECDAKSIFKLSLIGLISKIYFPCIGYHSKFKNSCLPDSSPIALEQFQLEKENIQKHNRTCFFFFFFF